MRLAPLAVAVTLICSSAASAQYASARLHLISDVKLDGMTREQLLLEREEVAANQPGLGLPVGLMAGGGGAVVLAVIVGVIDVLAAAASSVGGGGGNGDVVAGIFFTAIGVAAAGVVTAIVGLVKLLIDRPARSAAADRLEEIDRLLALPDEAPAPAPAAPGAAPPAPL